MNRPIYQYIASKLAAARSCEVLAAQAASRREGKEFSSEEYLRHEGLKTWRDNHLAAIDNCVTEFFPSGSGFDSGTSFDKDRSDEERLFFDTEFHHMSEHGMYTQWTKHTVIVTPSLAHGIKIRVTGKDHNSIKDYIAEMFYEALRKEVDGNGSEVVYKVDYSAVWEANDDE